MSHPNCIRRLTGALVAFLVCLGVVVNAPGSAAAITPDRDPFYRVPAAVTSTPPGTVLDRRTVPVTIAGITTPLTLTQLLFTTTDEQGHPTAAMTTVLRPRRGNSGRVVSYQPAYDSLGSQCNPSYTLPGGRTFNDQELDIAVAAARLAAGDTVVVPDYEGLNMRWTMGRESGQTTLDSVRAAEQGFGMPAESPVILAGYSGGSVPTVFGAELAPSYAPELNIVGAAAGGVMVNPRHIIDYIDGSAQWAGLIPALLWSYDHTFRLGVAQHLSDNGARVLSAIGGQCVYDYSKEFGGIKLSELLPPAKTLADIPGLREATARNLMGTHQVPHTPMMLAVGQSDPTGDGVMVTEDVAALAQHYCALGVPTEFHRYPDLDHTYAMAAFGIQAQSFIDARFSGQPVGCS